jgi:hypothetical protein
VIKVLLELFGQLLVGAILVGIGLLQKSPEKVAFGMTRRAFFIMIGLIMMVAMVLRYVVYG